jgi:hypothetical protein
MSRYVCHFLVNLSPQNVRFPLKKLFEACGMEPMYDTDDYVMAREIPGRVSFTRLVTAEVSIDAATDTSDLVQLNFLVKNDELPLNANNHCRQIFDLLRVAIAHNYDWQSLDAPGERLSQQLQSSDFSLATEPEVDLPTAATLSTILN